MELEEDILLEEAMLQRLYAHDSDHGLHTKKSTSTNTTLLRTGTNVELKDLLAQQALLNPSHATNTPSPLSNSHFPLYDLEDMAKFLADMPMSTETPLAKSSLESAVDQVQNPSQGIRSPCSSSSSPPPPPPPSSSLSSSSSSSSSSPPTAALVAAAAAAAASSPGSIPSSMVSLSLACTLPCSSSSPPSSSLSTTAPDTVSSSLPNYIQKGRKEDHSPFQPTRKKKTTPKERKREEPERSRLPSPPVTHLPNNNNHASPPSTVIPKRKMYVLASSYLTNYK
ncbi:hypothetical protein BDF14DRAFT_1854144 [Spinellus fusiger]|nr:hypothetical protein BDF14DRAFT_1854144 [Spinellus fusiger]